MYLLITLLSKSLFDRGRNGAYVWFDIYFYFYFGFLESCLLEMLRYDQLLTLRVETSFKLQQTSHILNIYLRRKSKKNAFTHSNQAT